MKSILKIGLVCLLALNGCTPDEETDGPPTVIASDGRQGPTEDGLSPTPTPEGTIEPEADCRGLGSPPERAQITLVENGELRAYAQSGGGPRCLVDVGEMGMDDLGGEPGDSTIPPLWNATADRVLIDGRALSRDGAVTTRLADERAEATVWSRPRGTSIAYISRGRLMKRPSYGGPAKEISFLERHDAVTYHPAGEHVATSGFAEDGSYGLYLATNIGGEPNLLARGEAARFITDLYFSENGIWLYYTARHGANDWHLHRLLIGEDARLETLAKRRSKFEYVVSPFRSETYAWFVPGDCAAGTPGTFKTPGVQLNIGTISDRNIHPVGWLPNGKLVVRATPTSCSTPPPGDIYVLSGDKAPVLIAEENYGNVSIRAVMPSPPHPPGEEQEVVA